MGLDILVRLMINTFAFGMIAVARGLLAVNHHPLKAFCFGLALRNQNQPLGPFVTPNYSVKLIA